MNGSSPRLRQIRIEGVQLLVEAVKEHRFVLVLRGAGLSGRLSETDPQQLGVPPLSVSALTPEATRTAALVSTFVDAARERLRDAAPAAADTVSIPVFIYVAAPTGRLLLGAPLDSVKAGAPGKTVHGSVTFTDTPAPARNVVAILPGSDPTLKGEYVAIDGHD